MCWPSRDPSNPPCTCRLVYDERGHFQSLDEGLADPYDLYDYDYDEDAKLPPGCVPGSQASFLLNNVPGNATWGDVAVNKAAFTISQQALPLCSARTVGNGTQAVALLPYVCTAVPARVATSSGELFSILPVPVVIVGLAIVGTAAAAAILVLVSALCRLMGCTVK